MLILWWKVEAPGDSHCVVELLEIRVTMKQFAETPDAEYWKKQIACQYACPVHTDARGYVRAIANGEYQKAYLIARGPNPLASICGRVCGAPCERSCRRGSFDKPIAIRALKRFVTERFGPESLKHSIGRVKEEIMSTASPNADIDELGFLKHLQIAGKLKNPGGKKVGIIGSGPAGLACAHDLALLGFRPVVYELESQPGGLLYTGIPNYRLPNEVIDAEIEIIRRMGVEFICSCEVGKEISFAELKEIYDAVVICVGARRSRWLQLPGSDAVGIIGGVDFLRSVAIGKPVPVGDRVVVIGGGNVAYDVARSALRHIEMDAGRMAVRMGAKEVNLISLETLEEMPADDMEILEGDEEGIIRHNGWGPVQFLTDEKGKVAEVEFQKCLSVFDENRRFSPTFDSEKKMTLKADTVLLTVGQATDLSFLDPKKDGIEIDQRGFIPHNPDTLETKGKGVYVAGDLQTGPRMIIDAVASGKKAARAIYNALTGDTLDHTTLERHTDLSSYSYYRRENGFEKIERSNVPCSPLEERLADKDALVEEGYTEEMAQKEASRCFDCGINTIFDGDRCVMCGGCVDVCPSRCLDLIPIADMDLTEEQIQIARNSLGEDWKDQTAIIKDETICIRCGLCYQRCPVDAISMERFEFTEVYQ
ncbi:MAG: NADPH-Fe(3+) oxidoreductase subunit beta [Chlamydiae bacterium]|nr:NADPH-Fe(3+) oxidoreductase subunit beta [Chlamydiota bacterium]